MAYIALEGPDAAGKDGQALLLKQYLEGLGRKVSLEREPDEANPVGRFLREVLRTGEVPQAHLPLFVADRLASEPGRMARLAEGYDIVQVRSFLSSLVYHQDYYLLHTLVSAHRLVSLFPTLVVVLRVPVEEATQRIARRGGALECYEKMEGQARYNTRYHELVRLGRGALPTNYDGVYHIVSVDGLGTPEEVHARVLREVTPWLG